MSVIFGKSLQEHFGAVPSRTALPADAFKRGGRDNDRFFGRNEKAAGYIILPEASYDAFASASEGGRVHGCGLRSRAMKNCTALRIATITTITHDTVAE